MPFVGQPYHKNYSSSSSSKTALKKQVQKAVEATLNSIGI